MMDINLSLGGYVYKFSKNDYNDTLKPNDVIHYKIDLDNGKQGLSLSRQQDFLGTAQVYSCLLCCQFVIENKSG